MDSPLSGRGKPGPDTVATDVTSRDLLAVAVLAWSRVRLAGGRRLI